VTDIMAEITSASHEQTGGIEQVNQAIGQMDEVTQQNAALVEEAAAAATSMQEQAAALAQVVGVFKLDQTAAPAAAAAVAVRPTRVVAAPKALAPAKVPKAGARALVTSGNDWEEF
jgi:type II secretory pathway component HofQ